VTLSDSPLPVSVAPPLRVLSRNWGTRTLRTRAVDTCRTAAYNRWEEAPTMSLALNKPKLDNLAGDIWKSAERLRGKFKA
jgi:hypothetical protein